jgi:hypothetical protein
MIFFSCSENPTLLSVWPVDCWSLCLWLVRQASLQTIACFSIMSTTWNPPCSLSKVGDSCLQLKTAWADIVNLVNHHLDANVCWGKLYSWQITGMCGTYIFCFCLWIDSYKYIFSPLFVFFFFRTEERSGSDHAHWPLRFGGWAEQSADSTQLQSLPGLGICWSQSASWAIRVREGTKYSQICLKRSPWGPNISGRLRQLAV